jgi:multidrug efflux pump subunit AcrA (membrane-fusion protein)
MHSLAQQTLTDAENTVSTMRQTGAATQDPAAFAQAEAAVTQARASLEQAAAGVTQASAGVDQARAAVTQARAASPESAVTAARAGVEAAESGLDLAQAAVDAMTIRAPKTGIVLFAPTAASAAAMGTGITPTSGVELMQGSAAAPGAPLFTVISENNFSFTADVDESDIRRIAVGQRAEITLSAYSGRAFYAEVTDISQIAKPTITGGTVFEVELAFSEDVSELRIGMRGDTTIEIETQVDVMTIPLDAWFSESGEDFVWVVDGESHLRRTPIAVGSNTDFVVEVTEGLELGQRVAIASGAIEFSEGLLVAPQP